MPNWLRQSTATTVQMGPFVEVSDGYSYKATTITLASGVLKYVYPNLAVVGSTGAVSLADPGWLSIPLSVSDTAVAGMFMLRMGNATNNLPVWREYLIVPQLVYDSMILGTDNLQVDVIQVTGSAPSNAAIGSVANLTTGVAVTSIAAGVGANVSSINAGVGVNASSINGGAATAITFNANILLITGAAVSSANINANLTLINNAAPSTAMPGLFMDYVMFTPGVQTITVKDMWRTHSAILAGKEDGATGLLMRFFGPSGEVRVSAAVVSGKRTGVTWVTGPS